MNIIKKLKHVETPPYIKISNKGTFIKFIKQFCIRISSYIPLELHRVLSALLSSLFVLLVIILWYNLHILIIVFIIILLSIFILYLGNYKNIRYKKSKHLHKSFQTLKNELLQKHILQINSINSVNSVNSVNSSQNASDSDEEFKIINNDNIVIDLKYMGNSYSNSCDISNNHDIIIKCSSSDDDDDDDTSSDSSSDDDTSSGSSSDDDDDTSSGSSTSTSSGSTEETSENKSTELETPSSLCNTNISSISYESIELFDTNETNTI
jgi:ABC-type multidrug transport system fused ATPase/permease subunit